MNIDPNQLMRRWVHSREEDREDEMVFRPDDFDFPPARGRTGFSLNANGTMLDEGPAPDDRTKRTEGKWRLDDGNHLVIEDAASHRVLAYEIRAIEDDRLVLRQIS